ncbi:MAG: DMT family transporter [Bacteroidales bacterium]|nr:DMT family transporter [Bacteroidales bacterium]
MSRKIILAHLAVIGANVIYGLNYVIAKGIMPDYLQPRVIILFRVLGAMIIFQFVSLLFPKEKVHRKDMWRLALCAVFGIAVNQIMFFEGLNLTTPINASIIMVGTPILVLVFSHFLIDERMSTNKIIGIFLGGLGASWLILRGGNFSLSSGTFVGNLLIVINASSYALFLVLVKPLMTKYSPVTIMKWLFTFGFFFILPFSVQLTIDSNFAFIPFKIWMSVAYVILFTTVLAYFLNNFSLKNISPTMNSSYIYLQPFLASLVALTLGKDRLTWTEVIAALFIFTGVYFVSRKPSMA